jgi:hypothetical protein
LEQVEIDGDVVGRLHYVCHDPWKEQNTALLKRNSIIGDFFLIPVLR